MPPILDHTGRPFDRSILRESQTAKLAQLHREWGSHPSRGLTPQKLARIFDRAELGDLTAQAELYEDMEEKDTQIFADMSKRKRAMLKLGYSVVEPRNASAEEKNNTAMVDELIQDVPNLEDVMFDMLNAIGHAYSCLEYDWQRLGSVWMPRSIDHRPQGWFTVDQDTRTQLRLRTNAGVDGEPLIPFGWIVHQHKAKSGYLARGGLFRVLAWPYLYRNYSARDLAELLEIYGLPLRLGKYPGGVSDDEKNTLLRALVDIGHNAAGIIPSDMEIEFKEAATGNQAPHLSMIEWCEKSVSKAILGGTLTSGADGKSSTNALGNIHNEVRHDLLVSDARQLEGTLQRDLIYPLLVLNSKTPPDLRRVPRLQFDTREIEDLKTFSDALPKLTGVGLKIPARYAYDKLRIPEPQEGEAVLTAPKKQDAEPLPADSKSKEALRTALAALKSDSSQFYPDQAHLDAAIERLPADDIQRAMEMIIKPALDVLRAGGSPDLAMDELIDAYPRMDDTALRTLLERAMFVADVWGRLNADT